MTPNKSDRINPYRILAGEKTDENIQKNIANTDADNNPIIQPYRLQYDSRDGKRS
jgi:hypothetical protein